MSTSRTMHQARLLQHKMTRKQRQPHGNYAHAEHQWGVVAAVNPGSTPTVDLYLDGSQNTLNTDNVTPSVKILANGYTPTVGDAVLVYRGAGRNRSSRVVIGKLNGAASPTPLPLATLTAGGQYVIGPNAMWGGEGPPPPSLGNIGDTYQNTKAEGALGSILYYKTTAAGWKNVL